MGRVWWGLHQFITASLGMRERSPSSNSIHVIITSPYEYAISMPIDNFRFYERSNGSAPKIAQFSLGFLDGFPVGDALVFSRLAMMSLPFLVSLKKFCSSFSLLVLTKAWMTLRLTQIPNLRLALFERHHTRCAKDTVQDMRETKSSRSNNTLPVHNYFVRVS
jgi:hypothetical protein